MMGRTKFREGKGKIHDLKHITLSIKPDGGSVMAWICV